MQAIRDCGEKPRSPILITRDLFKKPDTKICGFPTRNINDPDQVAFLFSDGAIISALAGRDKPGEGVHLDLSQRELTSFLLGEELLAAAASAPSARLGLEPGPIGRYAWWCP